MKKIARREFMQLSAVAAAGCIIRPGRADAQDLVKLAEDDPQALALKYTHDASTVDPATMTNPAPNQHCANCNFVQADEGEWRPCQMFPGKLVHESGWCSVWTPKA